MTTVLNSSLHIETNEYSGTYHVFHCHFSRHLPPRSITSRTATADFYPRLHCFQQDVHFSTFCLPNDVIRITLDSTAFVETAQADPTTIAGCEPPSNPRRLFSVSACAKLAWLPAFRRIGSAFLPAWTKPRPAPASAATRVACTRRRSRSQNDWPSCWTFRLPTSTPPTTGLPLGFWLSPAHRRRDAMRLCVCCRKGFRPAKASGISARSLTPPASTGHSEAYHRG